MLVLSLALLALAVAEAVWQRRHPLIVLSRSGMVIRPAFLSRSHELSYAEIAGWAHSARLVGFETLHGKRVYIGLIQLKKADRPRLLGQLESLRLGSPGASTVSKRDLERLEIRRYAFVFAAVILMVLLGIRIARRAGR